MGKLQPTNKKEKMLSVIIPAFNEDQALSLLVERLAETLKENQLEGEIVLVNDGSSDGTGRIGEQLSRKHNVLRVFHHQRRRGKTAAMLTGFENAAGRILVFMDADLQYAPEDLPKLLALIEEGYDVANGWRKHRKDSVFKKIPSYFYNLFSRISFGLDLQDHNSGFKAIRHEVLENINLKTDQHRFILILAHHKGFKVGEAEVQHFARKYGRSKYGFSRLATGLLDLIHLRLQLTLKKG